jgi:hypothetical protein
MRGAAQTVLHLLTCGCIPGPNVRSAVTPPVREEQAPAGRGETASTPVDREGFEGLYERLAQNTEGPDAGVMAALYQKLDDDPDPIRFNRMSHHLLSELMATPSQVQRPVVRGLLEQFKERLSPLAHTAADAMLYNADVHDHYHPAEGLPQQYGWAVSPVKRGLYDVQVAALRAKKALRYPLYRMPRLDQLAAELVRQAQDSEVGSNSGFAIARMAGFFHQVAFFFHLDKGNADDPVIHMMPLDSERRGKEIALQLRDALKSTGAQVKANIAAINIGTQFSPAGCPMFSPFNVETLNDDPALAALTEKLTSRQPLHEPAVYANNADSEVSIAVYNGEHFLAAPFFAVGQSQTALRHLVKRDGFVDEILTPDNTRVGLLANFENEQTQVAGRARPVNFRLERTHEAKTGLMLDYLKELLVLDPEQGSAKMEADVRAVRQSSLGDDDHLKMDRPCAAQQLADEIRAPVVWMDISPIMRDPERRQELLNELDRTDGPARMRLGYLQQQGYPVFSDWHVKDGHHCLQDDRYFHVHKDREDLVQRPSEYMEAKEGIRADADYFFVALPKSELADDRPAFSGLDRHVVGPRLRAGEN